MTDLVEPDIRPTPIGWLAVTPHSYGLRIGVQAPTVSEVRSLFAEEVVAWELLRDAPRPIDVPINDAEDAWCRLARLGTPHGLACLDAIAEAES